MRSQLQFALAAVLLAGTALFLHARSRNEVFPSRAPLSFLPHELGGWVGSDVTIPKDILDILGPGEFLLRVYRNRSANVDLFMAYFPTQRAGDTIHSPKNCLPGAGWSPLESTRITISVPGRASFPANRYVIGKGAERQLVLYWYWAHDRGVTSAYWSNVHLVDDSIRLHRRD